MTHTFADLLFKREIHLPDGSKRNFDVCEKAPVVKRQYTSAEIRSRIIEMFDSSPTLTSGKLCAEFDFSPTSANRHMAYLTIKGMVAKKEGAKRGPGAMTEWVRTQ